MKKVFNVPFNEKKIRATYLSSDDLHNYLDSTDLCKKFHKIAFDLETYASPMFRNEDRAALLCAISKIRTLQLYDGNEVFIFDFLSNGVNLLDDLRYFDKIYTLIVTSDNVAHNASFETQHIQKIANDHNIEQAIHIKCTMIAYRMIMDATLGNAAAGTKYNLKAMTSRLLGVDLIKGHGADDWSIEELSDDQLKYCAYDAISVWYCWEILEEEIKNYEMQDVYKLIVAAQNPVAMMKRTGLTIDQAKHSKFTEDWEENYYKYGVETGNLVNKELMDLSYEEMLGIFFKGVITKTTKEIIPDLELTLKLNFLKKDVKTLTFSDFMSDMMYIEKTAEDIKFDKTKKVHHRALRKLFLNMDRYFIKITSNDQIGKWLKTKLTDEEYINWPATEKTVELLFNQKKLKLDAETLADHEDIEVVSPLSKFKKYGKLYSTYGVGLKRFFVRMLDGSIKIFANFNLGATVTGRLSSSDPNLQNQPARGVGSEIQECYIASGPNRVLLYADYSQIEVRVAALLAGETVLLNAYKNGVDVHTLTASNTSGKPMDQITKQERYEAKAIIFGLLFGAGPATYMRYAKKNYGITIPEEKAVETVQTFRTMYPQLRQWQLDTTAEAKSKMFVRTTLGKVRALDEDNYYTTSLNNRVQGTAAECMMLGLFYLYNFILDNKVDANLVVNIHDSVLVDCHEKDRQIMSDAIESCLTRSFVNILPEGHEITRGLVECTYGKNWKEAKPD